MGIIDLLKGVGEDNLMLQFISGSLVKSVDKKSTQDTEITIATKQANTNQLSNDTGKVGIVVWVEREDYNKVLGDGL